MEFIFRIRLAYEDFLPPCSPAAFRGPTKTALSCLFGAEVSVYPCICPQDTCEWPIVNFLYFQIYSYYLHSYIITCEYLNIESAHPIPVLRIHTVNSHADTSPALQIPHLFRTSLIPKELGHYYLI